MNIKNDFHFKKKFGQNFISDSNIINSMVNQLNIDNNTLVIEIGPGSGALTTHLASLAGNVLCYEIDTDLKETLDDNLSDFNNVNVIYNDFLKADVNADIKKYNYKKLYLVANLPYYITTPIVERIINLNLNFDLIAIMVQKEVGERFNAKPGTKDYGSLTVYLNYYFDINKLINVPRTVFVPQPNVDSVVIILKPHHRYSVNNEELFKKLVRDSFVQKRKTIGNNLKNYDLDVIQRVF
jgi:16S rRNA (adenine1518-N6/adenine1519-N6)-dimethyltransferase